MWSWHSEVAAVMANVPSVQRTSAKEWMLKWGSVAHGCFFVHCLFNSLFHVGWSHLSQRFQDAPLSQVSRVVSGVESLSTFTKQPQPPACNRLQHPCPIHNHGQPVSLLSSFPLDPHNDCFPMSVMPFSQGPTCHSRIRGYPSWEQEQQPQLAQNEGWFRQSQWKYCGSHQEDRPSPVILELCPML